MDKKEDIEIINESLAGSQDAFAELVSRYKNLVYSVILRMTTDAEEANDLAQEVFIKVFRNLDKYSTEYKFSTWIIRITTNHVIDHRRKKRLNVISIDDIIYEPESSDTPESIFMEDEKYGKVYDALNSLEDMYRLPIVLYHQQGLSYQEIADTLDEPLSKIKNRIFRARKMLKDELEDKLGDDL